MFTAESRDAVSRTLVQLARADDSVTAAAVLGSGALGLQDAWSDIDLALRLTPGADVGRVADAWAGELCRRFDVATHTDVWAAGALYRVFLFADTLQVDVSFWPDEHFAARGPAFRLVFGRANPPAEAPSPAPNDALGLAWLYALHVRSSLARGRTWQAIYMLNAMREQIIQLACLRHDVATTEGGGVDALPRAVTEALVPTMPRSVTPLDLRRAFDAAAHLLLGEAEHADPALSARLHDPVMEMVRTAAP